MIDSLLTIINYFTNSKSVSPKFQDSLADSLDALFCPVERHPTVMKRFWLHLSSCLRSLLLSGVYPLLTCRLQVRAPLLML